MMTLERMNELHALATHHEIPHVVECLDEINRLRMANELLQDCVRSSAEEMVLLRQLAKPKDEKKNVFRHNRNNQFATHYHDYHGYCDGCSGTGDCVADVERWKMKPGNDLLGEIVRYETVNNPRTDAILAHIGLKHARFQMIGSKKTESVYFDDLISCIDWFEMKKEDIRRRQDAKQITNADAIYELDALRSYRMANVRSK